MIGNEAEYEATVKRLSDGERRLNAQRTQLEQAGLSAEAIERALDPIRSFHMQLVEEVEHYERTQRGA